MPRRRGSAVQGGHQQNSTGRRKYFLTQSFSSQKGSGGILPNARLNCVSFLASLFRLSFSSSVSFLVGVNIRRSISRENIYPRRDSPMLIDTKESWGFPSGGAPVARFPPSLNPSGVLLGMGSHRGGGDLLLLYTHAQGTGQSGRALRHITKIAIGRQTTDWHLSKWRHGDQELLGTRPGKIRERKKVDHILAASAHLRE